MNETLTREQADQLLERVVKVHEPSAEDRAKMAVGMAMKEAIATALGYESVEAMGEALEGKSLQALAIEKGVTPEQLETAQQAAAETALDDLVSAGTITQEQADSVSGADRLGAAPAGAAPGVGRRGGRGRRGHHGGRGRGGFKKQDGGPGAERNPRERLDGLGQSFPNRHTRAGTAPVPPPGPFAFNASPPGPILTRVGILHGWTG